MTVTSDARMPSFEALHLEEGVREVTKNVVLREGFSVEVGINDSSGQPVSADVATLMKVEITPWGGTFLGVQQDCERIAYGCRFDHSLIDKLTKAE